MDPLTTVATAVLRRIIAEHGRVIDHDDLAEAFDEILDDSILDHLDGPARETLRATLLYGGSPVVELGDGRTVDATVEVAGTMWSHRLTSEEIETRSIVLDPDLSVLATVAEADGGLHDHFERLLELRSEPDPQGGRAASPLRRRILQGPEDWMRGLEPGQLILCVVVDGSWTHAPISREPKAPTSAQVAAILAEIEAAAPGEVYDGAPRNIDALQLAGLRDGWWPPVGGPPFGELIAAAGLTTDGPDVGGEGAWARFEEIGDLIAPIARNDDLDEGEMSTLVEMMRAWDAWPATPLPRSVAQRLGQHPEVIERLANELRERDPDPEVVTGFLTSTETAGSLAAAAVWALGHRDLVGAERLARSAASKDANLWPALEVLAEIEACRGDLRQVVALLQRSRLPDDEELLDARRRLALFEPDVGRNEPCPCGSGRKFKQCHLGKGALPDGEEAAWLMERARRYLSRTAPPTYLDELVREAEAVPGAAVNPQLVEDVLDVALFEDDWLRRFLDDRGPLLTPTCLALGRRWLEGTHVSAFEVIVPSDADGTTSIRDLVDGSEFRAHLPVEEPWALGALFWTRLLPVDERWWTVGLPVPLDEGEAPTIAAVLSPGSGAGVAERVAAIVGLYAAGVEDEDEAFETWRREVDPWLDPDRPEARQLALRYQADLLTAFTRGQGFGRRAAGALLAQLDAESAEDTDDWADEDDDVDEVELDPIEQAAVDAALRRLRPADDES